MKKVAKKTLHKSALVSKAPGPVSYGHPNPMTKLAKELPKKSRLDPARKGTRKSGKAK